MGFFGFGDILSPHSQSDATTDASTHLNALSTAVEDQGQSMQTAIGDVKGLKINVKPKYDLTGLNPAEKEGFTPGEIYNPITTNLSVGGGLDLNETTIFSRLIDFAEGLSKNLISENQAVTTGSQNVAKSAVDTLSSISTAKTEAETGIQPMTNKRLLIYSGLVLGVIYLYKKRKNK